MCTCISEMNAVLEKRNGRLASGLQMTPEMGVKVRYFLATEKIDKTKRKPVPHVTCSHCPFCGEKLTGQ